MYKVAFINPPTPNNRKFTRNIGCAAESKGNYLLKPNDFCLLSAVLQKSCDLHWFDCVSNELSGIELIEKLKDQGEFDILILCMIDVLFDFDFDFMMKLYQEFKCTKIFVMGDAFIEEEAFEKVNDYIEGVIVEPMLLNAEEFVNYDKEKPLISGLRGKKHYEIVDKRPREVSIGTPAHKIFIDDYYQWPFSNYKTYSCVTTAWGCPFSCSYCTASSFPLHYRNSKEVITELDYLKELGVKEIYFTDLSFGFPRKNILMLLDSMIVKSYGFSWSCYFHPSAFDKKLLFKMKEAGCHTIIIGIESKDAKILSQYGRMIKPELIHKLLSYAKHIGIKVCGDFLIGLDGQDRAEIEASILYSKRLGLHYASFNIAAPLPGTSLRKKAKRLGLLKGVGSKGCDSLATDNVISLGEFSESDLLKLRKKAVFSFYLRPSVLISTLCELNSPRHFFNLVINFFQMIRKIIARG